MVAKGSPDPPDHFHDNVTRPVTAEIQNNVHSDSEDEILEDAINYEGYAPLPGFPEDERDVIIPYNNSAVLSSDSSEDEEENQNVFNAPNIPVISEIQSSSNSSCSVPPIESVEREVCRELWAGKFEATNIEMNSEKVQQVISVMANISLPSSSIPDWAENLSEEEWKQEIVDRISKIRSGTRN